MYERPADLSDADVVAVLREHWRLDVAAVEYSAVGYGGYHWTALDAADVWWFATASRITGPADVADLRATMGAARHFADAGLDFVVAPVRAVGGDVVIPAGLRYAITVFPLSDGVPLQWNDVLSVADRLLVTSMLAALHTTALPGGPVPVRSLNPRSRGQLESALRERGRPWRGGPYSEAARALVSEHAEGLATALAAFDQLVDEVARTTSPVFTHGELHPGNLIRRGSHFQLIDWDTAGLAPPERDLWSIMSDPGVEAARYAELTGHHVSEAAVALYRQRWDIDEIGLTLADFRAVHRQDKDAEVGWAALVTSVKGLAAPSD